MSLATMPYACATRAIATAATHVAPAVSASTARRSGRRTASTMAQITHGATAAANERVSETTQAPATAPTASEATPACATTRWESVTNCHPHSAVSSNVHPCASGLRVSHATTGGAATQSTPTSTAFDVRITRRAVTTISQMAATIIAAPSDMPADVAPADLMKQANDPQRSEAGLIAKLHAVPPAGVEDRVSEPESRGEVAVPVEGRQDSREPNQEDHDVGGARADRHQ